VRYRRSLARSPPIASEVPPIASEVPIIIFHLDESAQAVVEAGVADVTLPEASALCDTTP
jgi:hypothetical protein